MSATLLIEWRGKIVAYPANDMSQYSYLKATCKLYAASKHTRADRQALVRGVSNLFRDDHGADWCDDYVALHQFANAILKG